MEYFKGTLGGSISRPVPMTRSVPNIKPAVIMPGKDYETKGFGNRGDAKQRMMADIISRHPNLSPKDAESIAETTTGSHFGLVADNKKNKDFMAYMDVPLPEGTVWGDIKIFIDKFDEKHPARSIIRILLKGKPYRTTNFHEMHLENTKEGKISDGGKILYFMSLGSILGWQEDGGIPATQRKIKERLSEDLQKFFGLKTDPFVLGDKKYKLLFELSAREKDLLQKRHPKFLSRTAFDLLNDKPIFS